MNYKFLYKSPMNYQLDQNKVSNYQRYSFPLFRQLRYFGHVHITCRLTLLFFSLFALSFVVKGFFSNKKIKNTKKETKKTHRRHRSNTRNSLCTHDFLPPRHTTATRPPLQERTPPDRHQHPPE
jgi:hypothetical protein